MIHIRPRNLISCVIFTSNYTLKFKSCQKWVKWEFCIYLVLHIFKKTNQNKMMPILYLKYGLKKINASIVLMCANKTFFECEISKPQYCYTSHFQATILLHIQFHSHNIVTHPISKPQYCYKSDFQATLLLYRLMSWRSSMQGHTCRHWTHQLS